MTVEAAFLGIDVAKGTSGVSLLMPDYGFDGDSPFEGKYVLLEAGEVRTQDERVEWIERLLDSAEDYNLVPVVIAETWDPPITRKIRAPDGSWLIGMDQRWNFDTILGMGEGWGLWMAEIYAAEIPVVHRVTPNTWRDELFGKRREKSTEASKEMAKRAFEGLFGYRVSADMAEGAMLALYGAVKSPQVADEVKAELRRRELNKPKKKPSVTKAKKKPKKKAARKSA